MNKEQYLEMAKENEDLMVRAIQEFHPYYAKADFIHEFPITAKAAEVACEAIRGEIKQATLVDPVVRYKEYDANAIQMIANDVWFGMPESSSSRSHPAFYMICELAQGYE